MTRHRVLPGVALLAIWLASCGDENSTGPSQDGLLDPHIQPRVIGTYPSPHTTGPFELFVPGDYLKPHFLVQFNKLVDLQEFEPDWFSIEGFDRPVIVSYLPSNPYPYPEGDGPAGPIVTSGQLTNVLSLVVYDSLTHNLARYRVGKSYQVTVNSTLEDFTGNHPALPFSFSFTPEPYFRVVSTQPSAGDEGVLPMDELFLRFNSRVDAAIFPALHLTPGIPGKWSFVSGVPDSNFVSFQHLNPFPFDSSHTLTIGQDARDAEGNALHGSVSSSFHVLPFEIVQAYPQDSATGIALNNQISLTLSGTLDAATAWQAFHLEPPTPGQLLPSNNPPGITFVPNTGLLPGTRYTVTISTALRADDGTPLAAPYRSSFTTVGFQVIGSSPADGQYGVSQQQPVAIYCTGIIDPSSVQAAFAISPVLSGTFLTVASQASFYPNVPLAANTIYTVTISTALRSSSGAPLAAPYTFSFRTGG